MGAKRFRAATGLLVPPAPEWLFSGMSDPILFGQAYTAYFIRIILANLFTTITATTNGIFLWIIIG